MNFPSIGWGCTGLGGVLFEVVVMDDGSIDGTGELVEAMAAQDARVRVEHAPMLPAEWNGKQHACWAHQRRTVLRRCGCATEAAEAGTDAWFLEQVTRGLVSGLEAP